MFTPPAAPNGFLLQGGSAFRESTWDPDHFATVVLADFVRIPGPPAWHALLGTFAVPTPQNTALELTELDQLVYYRPSVLAEALAQNGAILQYFSGILDFNLRSRPATVYLCTAALRIASFQVMHYKYSYNRARPSRLSPRLMPPIEPPGHASFPSGHATQARLIALCLEAVMPAAIVPAAAEQGPLRQMAARIARNREVLGLHYPTDSAAGIALANETFAVMGGLPNLANVIPTLANVVPVARREWA
jgi:membrane-associated phospholipid phosphatase